MTSVQNIFDYLCELAPLELQMSYDNSGFLLGHGGNPVQRALLSLDITNSVIDEAVEEGASLIISHHPLIFEPIRSLTDHSDGAKVLRMAEAGIAAICMHTNLDIAEGGVNDVLIRLLGAEPEAGLDEEGCGRIGELTSPLSFKAFLIHCKMALGARGLRYCDAGKPVKRLAVMGGAGGSALRDAAAKGCDTYVTSDIKYHQFLDAAALGINLIDADHYYTENPVMAVLTSKLQRRFPDVSFLISNRHEPVISFF